jgi:hypothetical protein
LSRTLRPSFCGALVALAGLCLSVAHAEPLRAAGPSQDVVWTAQLGGIEATGLTRVTLAQVISISGLKVGWMFGPQDVEAARQRLLKSGLFTSVGFRYRNFGYTLIVTFTVQEVAWTTPVVFDNFVDHTDAQLMAAVARDVPSFDGVAPDGEAILQRIAAALERVAREAKDPGKVTWTLVYAKEQETRHWRFRLDRTAGPLLICSVAVPGLPGAIEGPVRERAASLVGVEYSRDLVRGFGAETVAELFASIGMNAAVGRVDVRREPPRQDCPHGVAVTLVMDAGKAALLHTAMQH